MNPRFLLIPLVAGLAFLAVACAGDTHVTSDNTGQMGVSASGTGTAVGEPDVMVLTVGVSAQRESVAAAREAAAAAQTAVIEALRGNGVAEEDIQTVQFSVNPQYNFRGETQEIIGYVVSNVVTAKVRDLDRSGDVVDAATAAGGNDAVIQGLYFGIDDPTELQAQAREEAVRKARAQAEQLASNAGASLGRLLSISESSYYPFYDRQFAPMAGGAADMAQANTPIQSGQLEISVTVNVLYAID